MKALKTIYEDASIEDLKACAGFENVSDEDGRNILKAIRIYTEIIFNCFSEERLKEEAKVITMNTAVKCKAA
jgi:hypothetical protein